MEGVHREVPTHGSISGTATSTACRAGTRLNSLCALLTSSDNLQARGLASKSTKTDLCEGDDNNTADDDNSLLEEDLALVVGADGVIGTLNIRLIG